MRARYYNPTIQRFVNIDPIRNGYNWYGYTSGNPINSIDPTGYFDWTSKKQWGILWDGMYAKMDEFSNYVIDGNKKFWSNPIKNLSLLAEDGSQNVKNTFIGGVNAVDAHLRGDINLFEIGKEYLYEQQIGIKNTFKEVGKGIWQLSPFSTVSDEDVYQLGYNLEGALLSTSESILVAYVGAKAPGIAKSVANKISPKLKSVGNKITTKIKSSIKSNKTPCSKMIGCFTEGTLVATDDGYKAIEDIEVGDYVWSENPYTGEVALKQVVDTFVYEKDTLVILQINGRTIETTTEHPFYVENIGWVGAKSLETGDVLRLLDGSNAVVENVEIKELDSIIKVYNFEVEDFHTYFVGEDRVLVHNDCNGVGGKTIKPNQVHHFATNKSKKYTSQFEHISKKYGLDLDDDWNKGLMPHQGRHPNAYHDYILDNMQKFDRLANGDKSKFLNLFGQMKQKIINNSDMLYKEYWKK